MTYASNKILSVFSRGLRGWRSVKLFPEMAVKSIEDVLITFAKFELNRLSNLEVRAIYKLMSEFRVTKPKNARCPKS